MNTKNILLGVALLLLAVGILKPDLGAFVGFPSQPSVAVENLNIPQPKEELMPKVDRVIKALSVDPDRKIDGKRLASLYNDIATLIDLDGDDQVIKNTEEIRQANRLSGLMLKLDIKGKYPELSAANDQLVKEIIGDDNILLDKELRKKASESFRALAWACLEGSK
jgi:hypothetical protein